MRARFISLPPVETSTAAQVRLRSPDFSLFHVVTQPLLLRALPLPKIWHSQGTKRCRAMFGLDPRETGAYPEKSRGSLALQKELIFHAPKVWVLGGQHRRFF